MKLRIGLTALALVMSGPALLPRGRQRSFQLVSDYIAEEHDRRNSRRRPGIRVVYDVYDSNAWLEARLPRRLRQGLRCRGPDS